MQGVSVTNDERERDNFACHVDTNFGKNKSCVFSEVRLFIGGLVKLVDSNFVIFLLIFKIG